MPSEWSPPPNLEVRAATRDATDPAPRTIEEARALLRRRVRVNTAYRRADQERRRSMAEANALGFTE